MFCDSLLHFFFFLPQGLSGAGQRREFAALLYRQAVRDRLRLGGTSGKGGRGKGKATTAGLTIFFELRLSVTKEDAVSLNRIKGSAFPIFGIYSTFWQC